MVAALILAISIVALINFALSYCRATLTGVSGQPVSSEVRAAAGVEKECITGRDFKALAGILSLTPGGSSGVGFVGLYYHVVEAMAQFARPKTAIAAWTEREMAICAHYVGVQIDRHMQLSLTQ